MRREVAQRAGGRCEYCQLSQLGQEARFHFDHILPRTAGGATTSENLALACVSCSLRKGARQEAVDPLTDEPTTIFHPRTHVWREHFRWEGVVVRPLTATKRATVAAQSLNRPLALSIGAEETLRGRHPPA